MNLNRLSDYLARVERRLRVLTFSQGAAITLGAALVSTVLAVLLANQFAFSGPAVLAARILLFLALAAALGFGLIGPLLRLNQRRAARAVEHKFPQFEERLLTFSERASDRTGDPFLELLAGDTLAITETAEPARVAGRSRILSFASIGAAALAVLIWLGTSGPGFLGYGTSLLWGGIPKGEMQPFYDIVVEPGNRTVRKGADQLVTARLVGFQAQRVRILARYKSASKWEEAAMRPTPDAPNHEFLFAAVPEPLDYYVEAGGMRSKSYHLNVVEMPGIKHIRVTYHFPNWTGLKDAVEDPGGDLRAVEGAEAEVAIETDRPLNNGVLLLDDGSKLLLRNGQGNWRAANVPISRDGLYHIAAVEQGEAVRLSEDYFIEAQKDQAPTVKITRPGRDARVNPVEEVAVAVEAGDDFGLHEVTLHYSVNGGEEKSVNVLASKGTKSSNGTTTLYLEDYKMAPGDIVSLYATARDARFSTRTDIFFIEAQPFEKNYTQSQQMGGGGGGGGDEDDNNNISKRQKEIISATWNQLRDRSGDKTAAGDNAKFLSGVQSTLRDQTASLARRMRSRELASTNETFKQFAEDMEKAVAAMGPASDKLKSQQWQDALGPEQKALQHLLRAEAAFRDIQVAFGRQRGGGGGGGGGAGRDLEGLFDLELDTEKNQYETGQRNASADQRQKEIDEALQKLEQLAKRQQELADQRRQNPQTPQQRWQQEMLRREAEQLQRQMQQLSRNGQGQQQQGQQQGQQAQQGQQGQQGQRGQQGQQGGQMSQSSQGGQPGQQQLDQAIQRLQQALNDMRQANSGQANGSPQSEAEARRAAERLKESLQILSGLRQQQNASSVEDLARKAEQLARQQQDFDKRLRQNFGNAALMGQDQQPGERPGPTREAGERMAQEKDRIGSQTQQLERDMQRAARDMAGSQREVSSRLRDALGEMQQKELSNRMRITAEYLRRGMGAYAVMREAITTEAMNRLADQLKDAQSAMNGGKKGAAEDKAMQQALSQAEQIRRRMQQALNGQQQGQQQGQRGQQQGQRGQQGGQQQGGQQQGGQQQGGQQQGGQQQGGQQQGGQQGGQQAGGQQAGGQRGGQQQGGQYGGRDYRGGANWGGPGWRGDWLPGDRAGNQIWSPERLDQVINENLRDLGRLQRDLQNQPEIARDVQDLIRDLQRLDPRRFANNPELIDQILNQLLAGVEGVELQLRRQVDDKTGGNIRSATGENVPPGFADAVAEYFRRLSKK